MEQTISFAQFRISSSTPTERANRGRRRSSIRAISQALQTPFPISDPSQASSPHSPPSPHLLSSLGDPKYSCCLSSVKQVHAQLMKTSSQLWSSEPFLIDYLIQIYSKFHDFRSAAKVLYVGVLSYSLSWRYLIHAFKDDDRNERRLLYLLRELQGMGAKVVDIGVLCKALSVCAKIVDWFGFQIHAFLIKEGLDEETYIKCCLMDFYAHCWSLELEDKLFDEASQRDSVLWNKSVVLNAESGLWWKALELFGKMQFLGVEADGVTIAKALHACGRLGAVKVGKAIHGYAVRSGRSSAVLISNSLVTMYSNNSLTTMARRVFELIASRSLVSWNSIISCYSLNGNLKEALELLDNMDAFGMRPDLVTWNCLISGHSHYGSDFQTFELFRRMQKEGFKPNSSSMTSVLRPISATGSLDLGMQIHGYAIKHELDGNVYVGTSLIDMYVKCENILKARSVFDQMKHPNVLTWNSMISGYVNEGSFVEALELLRLMEKEGEQPNLTTWNVLISGYSVHGLSNQAVALVRRLKSKNLKPNVVSWTAIISGCSQNGGYEDALHFFREMQNEGIDPNSATLASLLRACAGLSLLNMGSELHCLAMRKGIDTDIFVATALIDMNAKSGSIKNAYVIFKKTENKSLASWNAMITGFAAHGQGVEAISLFEQMSESGIEPDGITYTALLSGCSHSGLIAEGWEYFDNMKHYNLTPSLEHYTCMVDLLAKGGYLDEAWDFIQSMPLEPDASVWGALLVGCRTHRNLELAEISAKHLFRLEPYNSANYLIMMSLYACENRTEQAEIMRDAMLAAGLKGRSGWSWIQINGTVQVFDVVGKPHPDVGEIYYELFQLISQMRRLGYVPDTSCIAYNTAEEEKEKLLISHTEKLAITYGLINTDRSTAIKVIKNTRVCNDCHMVAKYISQITGREIFLKEAARFHHFKDGRCSCNDYW